jgi:hypothetical protein
MVWLRRPAPALPRCDTTSSATEEERQSFWSFPVRFNSGLRTKTHRGTPKSCAVPSAPVDHHRELHRSCSYGVTFISAPNNIANYDDRPTAIAAQTSI